MTTLRRSTRKRGNSEANEGGRSTAAVDDDAPSAVAATSAASSDEAEPKRAKIMEVDAESSSSSSPPQQPQQTAPIIEPSQPSQPATQLQRPQATNHPTASTGVVPTPTPRQATTPLPSPPDQKIPPPTESQATTPTVTVAVAPTSLSAGAAALAAGVTKPVMAVSDSVSQPQPPRASVAAAPSVAAASSAPSAAAPATAVPGPKASQLQTATTATMSRPLTTTNARKPAPSTTAATNGILSTSNIKTNAAIAPPPPKRAESPPPPLKALTFHHLQKKYSPELDYMLVEFRKLERQLLGAPINSNNPKQRTGEAAGSKERREKLHGFILHLEDTIRQIAEGCVLEEAERKKEREQQVQQVQEQQQQQQQQQPQDGQSPSDNKIQPLPTDQFTAAEASLSQLTPAKEKEESVQRLEEHILANLLPVKVRLTRQLAAQKGATRNPATAPVQPGRGGPPGGPTGGAGGGMDATRGSFAAAAEAKRKAQEKAILLQQEKQRQMERMQHHRRGNANAKAASGPAAAAGVAGVGAVAAGVGTAAGKTAPSQFGKPIGQARSSLTSRLHGRVLGVAPPSGAVHPATMAATATTTTTPITTGTVADPTNPHSPTPTKRRPILYAGMAPGSTQVPSSVNAVSGVHPELIGEDAARAVTHAEEERKRLARWEENAARVAAAGAAHLKPATTTTTTTQSPPEGPATLAARARAVTLASAAAGAGASSKPPRPNQPLPSAVASGARRPSSASSGGGAQHQKPPPRQQPAAVGTQPTQYAQRAPASAVPAPAPVKTKPKKPHIPLNYDDPSLTPQQQSEMRLREARWRQRKRRRERRRQRCSGGTSQHGMVLSQHNGHAMAMQGNSQQQQQAMQQRIAASRLNPGEQNQSVLATAGIAHAVVPSSAPVPVPKKNNGAYGPRTVEYVCAMCNESYPSSCDMNPWWALSSQDCPKCGKVQIPRLDITAATNAMEYHPALLAHLDGEGGGKIMGGGLMGGSMGISSVAEGSYLNHGAASGVGTAGSTTMGMHVPYQHATASAATAHAQGGVTYIARPSMHPSTNPAVVSSAPAGMARKTSDFSDSDVSHTDESDGEGGSGNVGGWNYDESSDEEENATVDTKTAAAAAAVGEGGNADEVDSVTREERAEREEFGFEYKGDKLTDDQARRLLVLIEHASTCPGRHQSAKHRNVCHSTKYLMLHIRDCPGLLSNGDVCPFPWCRKVKHLLYHLVSCERSPDGSERCTVCSPPKLSPNLAALVGLNYHRRHKFKERVKAILAKRQQMVVAASAVKPKPHHTVGRSLQHAKVSTHRTNVLLASAKPRAAAKPPPGPTSAVAAPAPAIQPTNATVNTAAIRQPLQQWGPSATFNAAPNSASAAVAASLSATTESPSPHQLQSPTLSSTLTGMPSMLSASALPTLEDATLDIDDIGLSASDLMGAVGSEHHVVSMANHTAHTTNTIGVKTETADGAT